MDKKPKLIQINTVCSTSTGHIMEDIQRAAIANGFDTLSIVGRGIPFIDLPCEKIGNSFSFWIHVGITTLFDRHGFGSYFVTKRIINRLRIEKPDIIHLHNIHGYYLNIPLLMEFLSKEFQGKIFWTFHDCWPITGHCAHFSSINCMKWKTKCNGCERKTSYPVSLLFDSSTNNFLDKKRMFTSLDDLTIIVPSKWMKYWVEQSFMSEYDTKVIANGIDLNQFSYKFHDLNERRNVLDKYGISSSKIIILGVASIWDKRKGLEDFVELSKKLEHKYQIVLVGVSSLQIRRLRKFNIVGIRRTNNRDDLTALYSAAQVFMNPSVEESFSLVTVEAFSCGTPVIVLDSSAVKELVNDNNGIVLHSHNTNDYIDAIKKIECRQYDRYDVSRTAQCFDKTIMQNQIIECYTQKLKNS